MYECCEETHADSERACFSESGVRRTALHTRSSVLPAESDGRRRPVHGQCPVTRS